MEYADPYSITGNGVFGMRYRCPVDLSAELAPIAAEYGLPALGVIYASVTNRGDDAAMTAADAAIILAIQRFP